MKLRQFPKWSTQFILILVTFFICFLNFQPHTWLTGWDNLHPEFNLLAELKRPLFSVWVEYRGLGLLGGMAHAAALPQILIYLLASPLLSHAPHLYRYFWTFSMYILGALGVYHLASHTLLSRFSKRTRKFAAFFAGLFYALNLGTIQVFFLPFETFTTFHGVFPWLLLVSASYLNKPSKKNFLLLSLLLFFSGTAFYVQTMFLVFLICLLPTLITHIKKLLPVSCLLFTIFLTQAYWLLPNLYFTLNSSTVTIEATQNQIATRETAGRNHEYGQVQDAVLLKGYLFDYVDLGLNNQFAKVMGPWVDHFDNQIIVGLGYAFFIISLIGIFYSFKRKLHYSGVFIFSLIIALIFLINLNPPTGFIIAYLDTHLPLFAQIFRSPFTKWVTPAAVSLSLFFSVGLIFIIDIFTFLHFKYAEALTAFTLTLLLIIYSSPTFQGFLISPSMRVQIPAEYFQLFDYFKTQDPNTRIANFPQHTIWGWEFYKWGYRGSGFLWYGLEQPILDRAFDVWSPYSEKYYQEMRIALYSQDLPLFQSLLEKYSIGWILLDKSIIVPGQDDQSTLYNDQLISMLNQLPNISLEKQFGMISVYRTHLISQPQNFFSGQTFVPYATTSDPADLPPTIDTSTSHHSPLKAPKNCDNFNSVAFDRVLTDEAITYSATDAQSCDHFLYPFLPHSSAYEIRLTHRNLTGLPLLICLEDYVSRQCLINRYLPTSTAWTTTTLTVPPMKPGEFGYTLHLLNYSIGRVSTGNQLRQIEITPIPYTTASLTSPLIDQLATISASAKPNYSLYTASVTSSMGHDALVLNQSYHPGWQAFLLDQDPQNLPWWQLYLTPLISLFRHPELDSGSAFYIIPHFEGNDWANVWRIPEGEHHLVIIFLPQYLQFLGFALLPLIIPIFLLHKNKSSFRI